MMQFEHFHLRSRVSNQLHDLQLDQLKVLLRLQFHWYLINAPNQMNHNFNLMHQLPKELSNQKFSIEYPLTYQDYLVQDQILSSN